ncbi:MAG: diphthamide synthesis protein [Thermodesulfovibrionia bacterium]|nr:diphthamide synthesis protein [Thermodesulfovibrionia bacterium]
MYNLDLEKAVEKIRLEKVKTVLIQLPDGLKPKAKEIKDILDKRTDAEILIWGGSCFGACDILHTNSINVDLLIQFGHSEWKDV